MTPSLPDLAHEAAAAVKALWLRRIEPGVDVVTVCAVLGDVAELADYLPRIVDRLAAAVEDLDDEQLDAALVDAGAGARHVAQVLDDALGRVQHHRSQDRSHEHPAPRPAPPVTATLSGQHRRPAEHDPETNFCRLR